MGSHELKKAQRRFSCSLSQCHILMDGDFSFITPLVKSHYNCGFVPPHPGGFLLETTCTVVSRILM